jgi:hypothetical protein
MRLLDDMLTDCLDRLLPRERLRDRVVDAVHLLVVLVSKERHVREHRQRVDRRRRRLGGQHVLVADAHPRFLSERRANVVGDTCEDSARGAAKTWVVLVPRLGEGGRRSLAQQETAAANEIFVDRPPSEELEQLPGVLVFGEETEQGAARVQQRRRLAVPPVLDQSADSVDRSDPFEVLCAGAGNR